MGYLVPREDEPQSTMTNLGEVLAHFRQESLACRSMGSPFMSDLIEASIPAIERPGATHELIGQWRGHPRADVLAARLASALHAAVLSGRAPMLASHYPAPGAPGNGYQAWSEAERFIEANREWVSDWISSPPQTNEVRRASGLFPAMAVVAGEHGLPVDLLELGASAGLNLSLDRFSYHNNAWTWGGGNVSIETDWQGGTPSIAGFQIAERAGCDQNPLDVTKSDDRLRLLSYIWPDQPERMARLHQAMDLAAHQRIRIDRRDAAEWIEEQLSTPRPGRLTLVFHSIFFHYPPAVTRARIAKAIADAGLRATAAAPLAWLRFEFEAALGGPVESTRCLLDLICWPGGARRVLAEVDSHGRFVNWTANPCLFTI